MYTDTYTYNEEHTSAFTHTKCGTLESFQQHTYTQATNAHVVNRFNAPKKNLRRSVTYARVRWHLRVHLTHHTAHLQHTLNPACQVNKYRPMVCNTQLRAQTSTKAYPALAKTSKEPYFRSEECYHLFRESPIISQ